MVCHVGFYNLAVAILARSRLLPLGSWPLPPSSCGKRGYDRFMRESQRIALIAGGFPGAMILPLLASSPAGQGMNITLRMISGREIIVAIPSRGYFAGVYLRAIEAMGLPRMYYPLLSLIFVGYVNDDIFRHERSAPWGLMPGDSMPDLTWVVVPAWYDGSIWSAVVHPAD